MLRPTSREHQLFAVAPSHTRTTWRHPLVMLMVALLVAGAVAGCGAGGGGGGSVAGSTAGAGTTADVPGTSATDLLPSGRGTPDSSVSDAPVPGSVTGSATDLPPPAVRDGSPLQQWLAAPVVEIAHHGGSASWPPASPLAYRNAIAWNPQLALEFSARRTADGVWVGSEDATTGAVYGTDLTIATSTWDQLSGLRSTDGGQPMSRLDTDLLDVAPIDRVLFVDDKDDAHVDELLDLLDQHGGAGRTVIKSYWKSVTTPTEAHRRGYLTWGYFYADEMDQFAIAQQRFDLLGINVDAPTAIYQQMSATGKRVIAHIIRTPAQADRALAAGATGLMVSGVEQVVPQG